MKLAYLIHTFPLVSLTFIFDEIQYLRKKNVNIDIYSVRKPDLTAADPELLSYARETQYVFPINPLTHLIRHGYYFFKDFLPYMSCYYYIFTVKNVSLPERLKLFAYFFEAVELSYTIRRESYDHLHVHFLFGGSTVAIFMKKLIKIRFSLTGHGTDFLVQKKMLKQKINESEFVRLATNFNRQYITSHIAGCNSDKLFVNPLGLEFDYFRDLDSQIEEKLSKGPGNTVRLINVGRLVWQKGQYQLIELANRLRNKKLAFHLEIIGEGELYDKLVSQIQEKQLESYVTLHKALPRIDVYQHMCKSDIFVFPSLSEGFGMVLLEAMMTGNAIVASRINGIPEIIEHGKEGLLFEKQNQEELYKAVYQMAVNYEERMMLAQNACRKVKEKFDNNKQVQAFLDKLHSTI